MPERKLLAWRPRPFPSFAPSIIPGRSSSCMESYSQSENQSRFHSCQST
jgi:hypothetical protein